MLLLSLQDVAFGRGLRTAAAFVGLVYFVILRCIRKRKACTARAARFLVRGGKQAARGVGAPVIQPNGH
ncbi:hypothetical protein MK974_20510 [Burkholderia ambifaria]|uniref:hypothetical protein n=1 Tax=Burkholderia ambifaria TaxID=152480 RepID=UPI0022A96563|nr:hypothetical protein [Burkholderia ambifaria]WAS57826.1 hypothetical protein MK974_20510 [Burkholderia ambifaria]